MGSNPRMAQVVEAEVVKGVEAGKKLPRKFLSLAESFGAKPTHFLRA